jgi:carbon storage regulator
MLVLSRKIGEQIVIGNDIRVTVVDVKGGRVKLGIEAPTDVGIFRSELRDWLAEAPVGGPDDTPLPKRLASLANPAAKPEATPAQS